MKGSIRSSLIIGAQGIRARKLRTVLSMVSLFLGVLAVVVVQAGSETSRRAAMADVELTAGKDGTLQMFVPPEAGAVAIALESIRGRNDVVGQSVTQATIGEPSVTPVNPGGSPFDSANAPEFVPGSTAGSAMQCDFRGCVKLPAGEAMPPGQAIELRLVCLTGDIRQFRPFRHVAGQWLDFTSTPSLAPRLVLNKEAAKGFSAYQIPAEMRLVGATHNATPQIIGVVDDGLREPTAYVRMDEIRNWMPKGELGKHTNLEMFMSPNATDLEQIIKARLQALGLPADYLRAEPINSKDRVSSQLDLIRWLFLGMAALVLLIGVAGILNVGLATVGERIEEFALRRAVGTPRTLLAGIVLAETMLTGLLTAGLAIGVAALGLEQVGNVGPFAANMEFPWQAGVAGVIAGLVAGLLGGLIPALRAARIPIATVMRA